MPAPYDGGCVCGEVRYRLHDEPLTFYACHCTDCQGFSGSAFGLSMPVRGDSIEVLRGEPARYEVVTAEQRRKRGKRCSSCGARLWGEPVRFPRIAILRPGTLDDPSWARPIAHIWLRSAQPWVPIPDGALRFEGQPEDDLQLLRAWKSREPG
jgi:hypothetical protein